MLLPQIRTTSLRLTILLCGLGLLLPVSVEARIWTTAEGTKVEAELVEIVQDGKGVLLDVKGKRYEVSLERLSVRDQAYVEGLQDAMRRPTAAEIEKDIADDIAEDAKSEKEKEVDKEPNTIRLKSRRTWTSREGVTVDAQFVRMRGSIVLLKLSGFNYDQIDFYDLSVEDRQFIYDAHAAMGKADMIPPVRNDLTDPGMEPPAYQEHPPTPSNPPMSPASGTGSSTSDSEENLPPNGFGSIEGSDSGIALPDNGFGAIDPTTTPSTPFDAEVKLPASGFGDLSNTTPEATEVHESFTPVGGNRPKKVGLPNSTIVDSSSGSESDDDRPLFDVASIPARSPGGFDEPTSNSPTQTTPEPQLPPTGNSPKRTTSAPDPFGSSASGGSKRPAPSSPKSGGDGNPQFGNSQLFTPSSEFTPIEPPAPREFTTADWNLQVFAVVMLSGGCLMMAGGYMWLIALAFMENLEWGLRSLIPGMAIMFGISEWDKASVPLLTMLLGVCLTLGGFGLLLGIS
ncbi:hypothetical protein DTL42_05045 [Bremerella cremea]|uniref:SLA1 homology domain-containing protein n=1 Tax=Bremerella cremea TaxID=1031537 RepID=A0A368KVR5_9BACT|nr:SHD1 domain-containing protein [Bremerella cremea]RCS54508.1 hypothetical protein DTL42_05045 [Bremerella cremea]